MSGRDREMIEIELRLCELERRLQRSCVDGVLNLLLVLAIGTGIGLFVSREQATNWRWSRAVLSADETRAALDEVRCELQELQAREVRW